MAWQQHGFKPTGFKASGDLSASQNRFVKQSAAKTVSAVAATTDRPIAVLVNAPTAVGEPAELCQTGIVKLESAGGVSANDPIGPSANGRAVTLAYGTDTTKFVCAIALEDGTTAGDVFPALLVTPHRAT